MTTHQSQESWEEEFEHSFPNEIFECFKQVDGSCSAVAVKIRPLVKSFISQTRLQAVEEYRQELEKEITKAPNDRINGLKQPIAGETMWLSKSDLLSIIRESKEK